MTEKLRLGMIGCGEIAYKDTAKSIRGCDGVQMVVAMDAVEAMARSFAETYGIEPATSLEEVLGRGDLDAVVISTPHYLHAPIAIQAARAGKHVIVEKPLACTLEQADQMIEECRRAGVLLGVLFVQRYSTDTLEARELVRQGAIGKVTAQSIHFASNKQAAYWSGGFTGRVQTDWRKLKAKSGGGVLMMNVIHDLDRLRFITGLEAVRVYAEQGTYGAEVEVEDFIAVTLRYDNGALGSILASSCARGREGTGMRIYGSEGQIIMDPGLRAYTSREVEGLKKDEWNTIRTESLDVRKLYFESFARALRAGEAPDVPGEEGRKSLEVVEAAYRAAELRRPVDLPMQRGS